MDSPRTMATQIPLVRNDFPTYGLRRLALVMRSGVQIPEAAPRENCCYCGGVPVSWSYARAWEGGQVAPEAPPEV